VKTFGLLVVILCLPLAMRSQNAAGAVAAKALTATAVQCDRDASDASGCHANYPAGCGRKKGSTGFVPGYKPEHDPYLNYFKNQVPKVLPKSQGVLGKADFDKLTDDAFTISKKNPITKNNHGGHSQELLGLKEGQYFTVIGYLYYSEVTGAESSNCDLPKKSPDDPAEDYHIGLGFDAQEAKQVKAGKLQLAAAEEASTAKEPATAKQPTGKKTMGGASSGADKEPSPLEKHSIVVEMTPHYRSKYHNGKWTHSLLESIKGRQVKVVGQLLLDNDHMGDADICRPSAAPTSCWRLSPWELHPVTEFYVCKSDSCTEDSPNWVALDDAPGQGIGKQ
jgi:hypothetical protein